MPVRSSDSPFGLNSRVRRHDPMPAKMDEGQARGSVSWQPLALVKAFMMINHLRESCIGLRSRFARGPSQTRVVTMVSRQCRYK